MLCSLTVKTLTKGVKSTMSERKPVILTGDRPTGSLHLGHYVGSLRNRVELQDEYDVYIIIADFQVLIDHLKDASKVQDYVWEIILDYLSVGIDPAKSHVFIQSAVPELTDLTMYLSMLVRVSRLYQNPTIKAEAAKAGIDFDKGEMTYGFLGYPVSQAADILLFNANLVPAGEDQRPHIEQTRALARTFNRTFGKVFVEPKLLVSETPRLSGTDGQDKMSKSLGNAIFLSDPDEVLRKKVNSMYTDPTRLRATDPGHVEGNVVFEHLDAFDPDKQEVERLKALYCEGGIGDVDLKKYLFEVLVGFLDPIRKRRADFAKHPDFIREVAQRGCAQAREIGARTMQSVREAVGYNYPKILT